jgi:KUP system potassium uptake protein
MTLAALGVVYGDIGTSPLYALRECFSPHHHVPASPENILGILSLILWSLNLIVSLKYLTLVMRADNKGEGGILALLALALPSANDGPRRPGLMISMGMFGAALLYGDGIITPAVSVMSAVEGLEVATTSFKPLLIPLTTAILIGLFMFQRKGSGKVGIIFGPVMIPPRPQRNCRRPRDS